MKDIKTTQKLALQLRLWNQKRKKQKSKKPAKGGSIFVSNDDGQITEGKYA